MRIIEQSFLINRHEFESEVCADLNPYTKHKDF